MSMVPEVSNTCHPANANATMQLIDERIARLQECIIQLKSERNGLAPISKLPPEVLGTIFYFASAGLRNQPERLFPCYNFTHVSRSWRSVALNTPSLWQVLPQNIPWATAMLERSKGADLAIGWHVIYLSPNHPMLLFLKEVLTEHASRIRELDLYGIEASSAMLFENLQQSPLRLRSLKLTRTSQTGNPVFPTGIMETGNLRTLAITGCGGPWFSLSLPSLTSLKLHDLSDRPPLVKFLEMLRRLPALEILNMDDSLPLGEDFVGLILSIELPRLSHLCLSSSSDSMEVTKFLSIIIVPPTATLNFRVENWELITTSQVDIILGELASSFSTFFGRLGQNTDLSYSNLDLFSAEGGSLHLKAWKENGRISAMPDLELVLDLPMRNIMLGPILHSLPFLTITTLTLDIAPRAAVLTLLENTFGHLSGLQNVHVVRDCTTEFIQALMCKPEDYNTEHAYYSVSFPALQSLCIQRFSFERDKMCLEDLQNCLMERYERRAELLKLKFTDCSGLRGEDVENLRDIVSDVECHQEY